jgi:hypothetical protein
VFFHFKLAGKEAHGINSAHPHQDFGAPFMPGIFYEGYVPGGTVVSANICSFYRCNIYQKNTDYHVLYPIQIDPLTFLCSTPQYDLIGDAAGFTPTGTVCAQMGEPEEQFMATSRDAHLQDVNVQH